MLLTEDEGGWTLEQTKAVTECMLRCKELCFYLGRLDPGQGRTDELAGASVVLRVPKTSISSFSLETPPLELSTCSSWSTSHPELLAAVSATLY